jgi:hypothetical protein
MDEIRRHRQYLDPLSMALDGSEVFKAVGQIGSVDLHHNEAQRSSPISSLTQITATIRMNWLPPTLSKKLLTNCSMSRTGRLKLSSQSVRTSVLDRFLDFCWNLGSTNVSENEGILEDLGSSSRPAN